MNRSDVRPVLVPMTPLVERASRSSVRARTAKARQFVGPPSPPQTPTSVRAAQYIRMSTDMQDYSPTVQKEIIAKYALEHGLEVVRTYIDEGKSGLTLHERPGLRTLLAEIADGLADFGIVLVYDVSRWGRFQDCDESAHYEYLCRRGGVRVEYCAEPFANDGSPMATVMKGLKRVMAGEYSRELSARVFRAKCSLAQRGFRQGGTAGYGFRRAVVRADGSPMTVLKECQHKFLREDRVVLVPGPEQEVRLVRWMFAQIADHGGMPSQMARSLNVRKVLGPNGHVWCGGHIRSIVNNPKYMGELVYNRVSLKLKSAAVYNPPSEWIRVPGGCPALVDPALFERAQRAIAQWSTRISNASALARLRELYDRVGWLSTQIIEAADGVPSPAFYGSRFGSLYRAYRLIGFQPSRDYAFLDGYAKRRTLATLFRREVVEGLKQRGVPADWNGRSVLVLDGGVRVAVMLAQCQRTTAGPRWVVQLNKAIQADWLLARRMSVDDLDVRDHWLCPSVFGTMRLGAKHRTRRERYEHATLEQVLDVLRAKAKFENLCVR